MSNVDKVNNLYNSLTFNPVLIIFIVIAIFAFWLIVKRKELWAKTAGAILFIVSFCTILMLFEISNLHLIS